MRMAIHMHQETSFEERQGVGRECEIITLCRRSRLDKKRWILPVIMVLVLVRVHQQGPICYSDRKQIPSRHR